MMIFPAGFPLVF